MKKKNGQLLLLLQQKTKEILGKMIEFLSNAGFEPPTESCLITFEPLNH